MEGGGRKERKGSNFAIWQPCIQRSIAGSSVDGVCAVVNNACGVLEQDFCGLLQSRIKAGFPSAGYLDLTQAYNAIQTSFQQGKLQAGGDASERQKLVGNSVCGKFLSEFLWQFWQFLGLKLASVTIRAVHACGMPFSYFKIHIGAILKQFLDEFLILWNSHPGLSHRSKQCRRRLRLHRAAEVLPRPGVPSGAQG